MMNDVPYEYAQACVASLRLQHWWRTPVVERHEFNDGNECHVAHNSVQVGDVFVLGLRRWPFAGWQRGRLRAPTETRWYAQSGVVTAVTHVIGDKVHAMNAWEYEITGDIGGHNRRQRHGTFFYSPWWSEESRAKMQQVDTRFHISLPDGYKPLYHFFFAPSMTRLFELSRLSFDEVAEHVSAARAKGARDTYPNSVAMTVLLHHTELALAKAGVPSLLEVDPKCVSLLPESE